MCPAYTCVDRHIDSAPAAAAPYDTLAQTLAQTKNSLAPADAGAGLMEGLRHTWQNLQAPLNGALPQDIT